MTITPTELRELYARKASAMTRRPAFALGAGLAHARISDGVVCEVDEKDRTLRVDLPPEDGGAGSGPHPGQLMRASIAACLAMGYKLWAARLDLPIERVEVELTCEYDARGQMDLTAEVPVGWQRVAVDVTIASSAPEEQLRQLVETTNRLSPMLANLSPHIRQVHRLTIVRHPTI